jgi:ubiquinone/menaquinone biosynthesis C-methylase UbiE
MNGLAKGFDRLAPIYDLLARIVIGKGIRTSQLHFLTHLQEKRALLILGGGTGWILPFIFKLNPTLHIDYIELSKKMIGKAKRNARADQRIRFIEGTEATISGKYDCIITNFYLDLFTSDELYGVVRKIKSNLQPNSCWVATDFVSDRKWHCIMLWIMYRFFKMTTGLKTLSLPNWEESMKQAGGKLVKTKLSSRGFIKSAVFQFQN